MPDDNKYGSAEAYIPFHDRVKVLELAIEHCGQTNKDVDKILETYRSFMTELKKKPYN